MTDEKNIPASTDGEKPAANEYIQPFAFASLAAVFGFGYKYYNSGDLSRAITIGGVCFLILFWVVLRGNNIIKNREKNTKV